MLSRDHTHDSGDDNDAVSTTSLATATATATAAPQAATTTGSVSSPKQKGGAGDDDDHFPPCHQCKPAPSSPFPYTAREAAEFARLGACMVAWPPDEVWTDPLFSVSVGQRPGMGRGDDEE
ncbi:hypothetical protein C7999DRAFT_32489 [Corynascus novoguineensis]|uniref:Uncharacterized protein n=1 Tax=Corynascus novoguineensis TaxID=1126955 RepID=A0AAN7CUI7_9PEZI|nr:hypothetical protein C7999DRAFT_32489 [Corynascus novoguineensis]